MSGGQQQRVALARALVIRPRILLLDEPLSNLDAKLREEMQIELRQIQRSVGITTILVTHDQGEAMALSDRIVVMNKGRVEQIGRPHEAYENPASAFVAGFLGKTNLIPAQVEGDGEAVYALIGDGRWPVQHGGVQGRVTIAVRPEKVGFAEAAQCSLGGRVRNRVFQGNHWLYQVETPTALLTVIRQNSGERPAEEGDSVRLTWRAEDMTIRPAGEGAS
jgi:putative spermidine/putrescine transport system ATP-binding protein